MSYANQSPAEDYEFNSVSDLKFDVFGQMPDYLVVFAEDDNTYRVVNEKDQSVHKFDSRKELLLYVLEFDTVDFFVRK